jgi:hypothetical protein
VSVVLSFLSPVHLSKDTQHCLRYFVIVTVNQKHVTTMLTTVKRDLNEKHVQVYTRKGRADSDDSGTMTCTRISARTKQKAFLDSTRYRRPHPTALRTTRLALGLTIKGKKLPFQHADNEMMLYLCIASAELYHLAICHLGVACFQITVAGPHAILHQSLFTGKTSSVRYRIQLNSHQIQEAVCMTARLSRYAPHMLMYHC